MKTTTFGGFIALFGIPAVQAQVKAKARVQDKPTCTASLITNLCSYPEPKIAVASGGKSDCWEYCDSHSPCNFVIFAAGNPHTGTGTCWVYPGETFDASKGTTKCANDYLSVYNKPVCSGGPTPTAAVACAATASPSVVAGICDYPTPPGDCKDGCTASSRDVDCLSQCANAPSCNYVVFNPTNEGGWPYGPGSCWMYPKGSFDPSLAKTCIASPKQYVYYNVCPKPSPSVDPLTSSSGAKPTAGGPQPTGTGAVAGPSGTNTAGGTETPGVNAATTSKPGNSAANGISFSHLLALGAVALFW